MKNKSIIILLILTTLLGACDGRKPTGVSVNMLFEHPFTVTPSNDTINIGDTLLIEGSFSDTLYEFISKQKYHLHNFKYSSPFFTIFKINDKIAPLDQQQRAINKFDTINYLGNIDYLLNNLFVHYHLNYDEQQHRYAFKIGLIAKEKGLYNLHFSNREFSDKNQDLRLYIDLGFNNDGLPIGGSYVGACSNCNNGNNHFKLLYENSNLIRPISDTLIINQGIFCTSKSTYTFVVK